MEVNLSRDEFADSTVPDCILQYLATELAEEWKTLARCLDIGKANLHNIVANHSGHMQDTKYYMLRHWSEKNGTGATYRVLSTALDKAGRRDLREYVESQDKEKDLIRYSKLAYPNHYKTAKPFPSKSKCMVNDIFVEGGIYYLAKEGDSMQKLDVLEKLESYNDILSSLKTQSKRKIIEADPWYGKSTLALQFVYDWCTKNPESPLKDVEILIYLQLRQLAGVKSIYTAIKNSIVPKDEDMDEACIKEILRVYKKSVVMIFDSYDEYPDKNESETDISYIIEMKMFQDNDVIIFTRTLNLPPNLHPETKRIRLTGFGEAERRNYVLKAVADDVQLAGRIEEQIQRNPFIRDLCQVPLFATMVAHIAYERPEIKIFSTVTRFFTYVIACLHNHMENKRDAHTDGPAFEAKLAKLYRIAFEGLTRRNQQLSWEKTYLVSELGQEFYDNYIKLGMLAQEVVFDISKLRNKKKIRIWHKIICEFYAAHHLVWILSEGASSTASSINVKETLNSINPLDLQYVFGFACGLNKSAADIIIKHLQETTKGRQGAILCMLEHKANSDQYLQSVDLVSYTTHTDDANLLQRSTIQVLEVASANQDGVEDSAASSSDKVVDAGLSQSQKKTGDESLTVKQPLENIDPEVRTESLRFGLIKADTHVATGEAYTRHNVGSQVNFWRLHTIRDNPSLPSHQAIRGEAEGNPAGAEAMTKDSEVVKDSTLWDLSGNLSKGWRDVGRKLKLKETDLRNIEADNTSNGQKEVDYQMLLLWKHKHGMKATNKTLRDALNAANRKDLSDYLLNREQCGTTSGTPIE